ncbi:MULTISPECIES: helix-turn-helix domain-containing protein [unclassified Spirosoma]|uniref:helix-turn-helix domain-containing protein n=1 Tax=unclassified Spirosoma TaxID=2621999 RepID=UPI00095DD82F|nr:MULTISPECIES: helix-turn-helix domain-containing protein [unclassified Spirosoma]OJW76090.1 MAG: AraC family transcriptional regulator [Spirosoma sp. 48-14]
MHTYDRYTMVNPQNGNLAFSIYPFDDSSLFSSIQRFNYFSLILWKGQTVDLTADFTQYPIAGNVLLAFSPFQPFQLRTNEPASGWVIHFHPEFFCIFRHHPEISANGFLFNNSYHPPFVRLTAEELTYFELLTQQMANEIQKVELAQHELLISYLKIILIQAVRLTLAQYPERDETVVIAEQKEPFVIQKLKDAIEQYFRSKHTPSDYADLLTISPKALAKITRHYFSKTLTDLISDRIVIEAKRELYLTPKSIKEIAHELGFEDEFYFSRFFKRHATVSPQVYRDTVGFNRAANSPALESN